MALSIVGISGNVTRPSRTAALVGAVLAALEARLGAATRQIELVDAAPLLFQALTAEGLSGSARELVAAVEAADLLVVATPVYRASYTGALKHLFDLVGRDSLAGKPVVLGATGGSPLHGLVTEHQLRPLFGYFGSHTLPTTLYAVESDFQDYRVANPAIAARIARVAGEAAAAALRRLPDPARLAHAAGI